ncbi:putative Phytanoyl-CoA dioxygenase [Seiridium unicorne]|uniref:Phytanoyl-CoA dioxygenase n=1 Tax=Seiridium unicorne TaxID=138068 RepID=A0ABR2VFG5_9PEZI
MAGIVAKPSGPDRLFNNTNRVFGDFRDNIVRDGYVVVKGAVPRERAEKYAEEMYNYLETFKGGLGFKRFDPSTYREEFLPVISERGMCSGYGVNHESFTWDIRCEPGVVDAFAKVFDTDDLIVSFDAVSFALPNRKDTAENKPWPHQDQDPEKPGFRCLQGVVNLLPNGPKDGGLIVCKGAHKLSDEFHEDFKNEVDPVHRWTKEWYGFSDAGMKWLAEKGCEWIKVEAEPGDLLLWDSRLPHYNMNPTGDRARFATYTCYMPAAEASQEDLLRKKEAFEKQLGTTHWPNAAHVHDVSQTLMRKQGPCPYNDDKPRQPTKLNERGLKLTGIPYIATSA